MDVQMLAEFINGVGFPIFVAVFMLFVDRKDTKEVKEALQELKITNQELITVIKMLGGNKTNG